MSPLQIIIHKHPLRGYIHDMYQVVYTLLAPSVCISATCTYELSGCGSIELHRH
jgi:hypothetical protein